MTIASVQDAPAIETGRYVLRSYTVPAIFLHWLTAGLVVVMVSSAVIAKQLHDGPWADTLLSVHKATGILTLAVVLLRLAYRIVQRWKDTQCVTNRRASLHWLLYLMVVLVPLVGWAGVSDFGSREIVAGIVLPQIWPEGSGYWETLFVVHACLAFGLLALVLLHIGAAMHDYMMRADGQGNVR